jgi:hypothetical protein
MSSPDVLRREAARLLAEAERLDEEAKPKDRFVDGTIIRFTKVYDGRPFDYAALKAAGRWYLTGRRTVGMTWDRLVLFIGADNATAESFGPAHHATRVFVPRDEGYTADYDLTRING